MSDILKLKYKVGEIEFEAEGPAEAVEQQRVNFMNVVLPAAVDAMVRTQAVIEHQPYIDAAAQPAMLEAGLPAEPLAIPNQLENDFSRTSLASFLKNMAHWEIRISLFSLHILTKRKMGPKRFLSKMLSSITKRDAGRHIPITANYCGNLLKRDILWIPPLPKMRKLENTIC